MKKMRGVFALTLFALALMSFLIGVSSVVSAATPNEFIQAYITNPIKTMFTEWEQGALSINVAKYSFIILLILLIYSIVQFLPFLSDAAGYIQWLVAILVGFLSGAYLTPSDVYAVLTSYGALGLVLGGILPFIIIAFFSFELSKHEAMGGKALSYVIWTAFVAVMVIKLISGIIDDNIGFIEGIVYIVLVVGGLIFIFAYNYVRMAMLRAGVLKGVSDAEYTQMLEIEGRIAALQDELSRLTGGKEQNMARMRLKDRIAELKDVVKNI